MDIYIHVCIYILDICFSLAVSLQCWDFFQNITCWSSFRIGEFQKDMKNRLIDKLVS